MTQTPYGRIKEASLSLAQELKQHPERWCKDVYHTPDGKASCLAGHLNRLQQDGVNGIGYVYSMLMYDKLNTTIMDWNDAPERTVEDVIALCETVGEQYEQR